MTNFWSKTKTVVWGKTPENPKEAKLLVKIDWLILSCACLIYWINYLDRMAFASAYVSSMSDDLTMKGNEYNIINTCFTVGYTVFLIPHNLILLKVRPKYWLSFCTFSWGLLTFSMYKVTNYKQICIIRFFLAGFESCVFSGIHLILLRWYKKEELALRTSFFVISGQLGNLFSSTLQSAIYTNMDNYRGLAGWRWLFIIDFLITLFVVAYLLIFFIDYPEICHPYLFTKEELELAKSRLPKSPETKFDWTVFKRVVGRWHWWLFSFLWVLGGENESFATNSLFSLWLQYYNYTIPQRNHYPMGIYGIGAFVNVFFAFYIDYTGAKYHWRTGIVIAIVMVIASILMLAKPYTASYVFAAQYLGGVAYGGQTVFFAWANNVCFDDLEERAVVLASMNMFSNAVNAWWLILFYAADTVPEFKKGNYAMLATAIASGFVCGLIRYLQVRDEKRAPLVDAVTNEVMKDLDLEESIESGENLKHEPNIVSVKTHYSS